MNLDDQLENQDFSVFDKPKCKWNKDQFIEAVQKGRITQFWPPSPCKTPLNDTCCDICYQYYPRINKCNSCNFCVCSNCLIFLDKCPQCKKEISVLANCSSGQLPKYMEDEGPKYPADTLTVAEKYGIDTEKVKKLLESGVLIEDLFQEDDIFC